MLDYRIETFITLCKERNYSKTAQKLCITQPAVTQHIQYLERYYNCKLFEYENKQLKLTAQGKILERMALGLSASTSRFKALITEIEKRERTFILGASITVSEYMIPPVISTLLREDPTVNLNIQVASGKQLINDLKNGTIECAFIEGEFNRQELHYHKFTSEEYILVSSKPYESVDIDDLLGETLITRESGSSCYELLSNELFKHGRAITDFSRHVYTNNVSFIKQLILNGVGIGLLYKPSVQKELDEKKLFEIPVNMNLFQEFHFVMLQNNMFAKDYDTFFEFAASIYEEYRNSLNGTT